MEEQITAHGHEHVSAEHASTFEVTSDDYLTPAGDCILAIEADTVPAEFDPAFRAACQDTAATISVTVSVDGYEQTFTGHGHPDLTFDSDRSLVCRTSDYIDERTVAIGMDGSAQDFDRPLVSALAAGKEASVTITVD